MVSEQMGRACDGRLLLEHKTRLSEKKGISEYFYLNTYFYQFLKYSTTCTNGICLILIFIQPLHE